MSLGIFQDAVPRSDISGNPSHHVENKFCQNDTKVSSFQDLDQNGGLILKSCADLVSPPFHVPQCFLMSIRMKMMPTSVNPRRNLRMVLLEQVGFQTR